MIENVQQIMSTNENPFFIQSRPGQGGNLTNFILKLSDFPTKPDIIDFKHPKNRYGTSYQWSNLPTIFFMLNSSKITHHNHNRKEQTHRWLVSITQRRYTSGSRLIKQKWLKMLNFKKIKFKKTCRLERRNVE